MSAHDEPVVPVQASKSDALSSTADLCELLTPVQTKYCTEHLHVIYNYLETVQVTAHIVVHSHHLPTIYLTFRYLYFIITI